MKFDLLIKNGTVIDGTGGEGFPGSLAVKDGKIAALLRTAGDSASAESGSVKVLDAGGQVICPGFIDMHSHADWVMPLEDHPATLKPLIEQGITTVIAGNCGYSPVPLADGSRYLDLVAAESEFLADRPFDLKWKSTAGFLDDLAAQGLALNLAMLAGHGNLRLSHLGSNYSYPGDEALAPILSDTEQALDQGAFGISLGLGYAPGLFTDECELLRFAALAKKKDRILTVHLKAYTKLSGAYPLKLFGDTPHNLKALREALFLAEQTGVKLQISHMLFVGEKTWPMADSFLEEIDKAFDRGIDVAFDAFPYTCGNTTIYIAYPTWFRNNIEKNMRSSLARLRLKYEIAFITSQLGFNLDDIQVIWGGHPEVDPYTGLFFDEIAKKMNCSLLDAYLQVSDLSKGKTLGLMHKYNGSENERETMDKVLLHPLCLYETDTILTTRGLQNPSSFGAFPRIIERYCRESERLSLGEAISRMTSRSAKRFGIKNRGEIKEGYFADLAIFDPGTIADNTNLRDLERKPSGIAHVFINGIEVVRNGEASGAKLPGMALRYQS